MEYVILIVCGFIVLSLLVFGFWFVFLLFFFMRLFFWELVEVCLVFILEVLGFGFWFVFIELFFFFLFAYIESRSLIVIDIFSTCDLFFEYKFI